MRNLPLYFLIIVILSVLGGGSYMLFNDAEAPSLVVMPDTSRVSPHLLLTVTATDTTSNIRSIKVTARKDTRVTPIFEEVFTTDSATQSISFTLEDSGLREGSFELQVQAVDTSWAGFGRGNSVTVAIPMLYDTTMPRAAIKTQPPYVRKGGMGCVVLGFTEDVQKVGVKVDDYFFPAYRQANGDYVCLFAFPYEYTVDTFQPRLVAEDLAGNQFNNSLPLYRVNRNYRHDKIVVSDSFLNAKIPNFEKHVPGEMTNLARFIKVNSELRKANVTKLRELAQNATTEFLWEGAFVTLPNGANKAGYGEHRSYMYNGEIVDEQTHMGLDLASLAMAAIPAANKGKVIFADDLGIYGNVVILDHGLGLQTLYSHCTDLAVSQGDVVNKGQIIGRTGTTGMAVGDHVHFGVTVSGVEVNPLELLDASWVRTNILAPMRASGMLVPEL